MICNSTRATAVLTGALLAMLPLSAPALDTGALAAGAGQTVPSAATAPPAAGTPLRLAQSQSDFERWKRGFRAKALANGISPRIFDSSFQGVRINSEVLRLNSRQAEFTKPIWEYLDTAVSDNRIANGRANYRKWRSVVESIERRYGVEASVVVAVWGMETNYGSFRGDIGVIEALATLAMGGRRSFAEEQLIAAMRIVQNGDTAPSNMRGSWAGAMGHTQFIPTSYLAYAQDFNGDGRRDVWAEDPTDALASTANYLKRFGWTYGQPWGVEVRLPAGFNFGNIDQNLRRPVSRWTQLGVRGIDGNPVRDHGEAALIAPAGARGPIFMVFNNFRVIKRYNNATSYAMGVGHLARRIVGDPDFTAPWPRGDRTLSRSEKVELQQLLTRRGFSTGGADGVVGPNTQKAIRGYQRSIGVVQDGYASLDLLRRLRGDT